ncbi:hypothetical protein [Nocardioides zeae]|uniref:Uncharacterized protein n=1 Tax=Nocardioides zeae TaxID=1457234 RepID=A0A6P0HK31_9ACTN|nr:hypothetical protein [Nocardioides zeae]
MDDVTVTLSQDEALVLWAALRRWNDSDALDGLLLDGEPTALHGLLEALRRTLAATEGVDPSQVNAARSRLVG